MRVKRFAASSLPAQASEVQVRSRMSCPRFILHGHLLEIAFLLVPHGATKHGHFRRSSLRWNDSPDPEVDVALVCEQMLGLAQVLWWLKCGGELSARFNRVPEIESTTPKQQLCAYILPEHQALTAFPWLETAG